MTDLTPGRVFVPGEETLLTDQTNSLLAHLESLDANEPSRYGVVIEFTGRRNHSEDPASATVVLTPRDAYELTDKIMSNLETLVRLRDEHRVSVRSRSGVRVGSAVMTAALERLGRPRRTLEREPLLVPRHLGDAETIQAAFEALPPWLRLRFSGWVYCEDVELP